MSKNTMLPKAETEINGQRYLLDAQGNLYPLENIKEVDMLRHELVRELLVQALETQETLRAFKRKVLNDLHSFVDLSTEKYGARIGGRKGNAQFLSFDNKLKIQIQVHETLAFDERLQAAKALIDECLQDWAKDANTNLKVLIADAFKVNRQRQVDTKRILSLRKLEIHDERWQNAMSAIGESLSVQHSKEYVRFYIAGEQGEYVPVSLDIAAL